MSYHEGESSSLDPSTMEQELSKFPIEESTQKNDSGANDQVDISSHDEDIMPMRLKSLVHHLLKFLLLLLQLLKMKK